MDRQCKKTALEHLQCSRQCKKTTTAIYIWTDSAKKQQQFTYGQYIFTDCTEDNVQNTYIYSVHIVYYKDILNYQRHQDKKTMSSSEDEVDSLFEESMVGRINSLEKLQPRNFQS